jgi:hypothetical protein
MLLASGVCIGVAGGDEHHFYLLLHRNETLRLMRQLATRAMRRLVDVELTDAALKKGDLTALELQQRDTAFTRMLHSQKSCPAHALFKYFEDGAASERYQRLFQLPNDELLELEEEGTVFDPSLKEHVEGTAYFSQRWVGLGRVPTHTYVQKNSPLCGEFGLSSLRSGRYTGGH